MKILSYSLQEKNQAMIKNKMLKLLNYICLLLLLSCSGENSNKDNDNVDFKQYTEYVKGKGYCVGKLDKDGCNTCSLNCLLGNWSWSCTAARCSETVKRDKEICVNYLPKEELLKKQMDCRGTKQTVYFQQ